jgi:hypothetical protein
MYNLFVLGNGESRQGIMIPILRRMGKVWGCNGMYRDHKLDGIIAVDPMLEHEIYRSGYAHKHKTYFRDWEYIPAEHYDMMKEAQTGAMQDPNVREWKYNPEGYYLSFVIHGQSAINQKRITERWKGDGYENVYITWLYGTDRIRKIKDVMENIDGEPADLGWCSGATAMYIACKEEQPKTCYLLGMDMYSQTDKVNNLYKGTKGYVDENESALIPENWVIQKAKCMMRYPNIEFIKVQGEGFQEIPEWQSVPNLKYMSIKKFKEFID